MEHSYLIFEYSKNIIKLWGVMKNIMGKSKCKSKQLLKRIVVDDKKND